MNNDLEKNYISENTAALQAVYAQLHAWEQHVREVGTPEELEALEREIRGQTARLSALLVQRQLQAHLDSEEQEARERALLNTLPGKMKSEGLEAVRVLTREGVEIILWVRYYRRACDRRNGKRHKGVYAGLVLLGIHDRTTPALAATVSAWSALLGSFEEVRQVLREYGVELGVKVLRKLAYRYADRARVVQQAGAWASEEGDQVRGRRVVVSADGGRVRLRENKRGRKTEKGRTRYKGAWREPKLLIVYVVDAEGKLARSFAPVLDGLVRGPDAFFRLLRGYVQGLGLDQADRVLFVADGAHWIWNRVPGLVQALGLNPARVHQLIDFYHAVEHLGKVAALRKSWSAKERKAWWRKHRGLLLKGQVEAVVEAVQAICRGRRSKAITTERNYFMRNRDRMDYPRLKALGMPIGSGAVESAIRRVVNLRLKGPCIFWYKEHAEKMLMLRAYYKAGRWNLLKRMANSPLSLVLS